MATLATQELQLNRSLEDLVGGGAVLYKSMFELELLGIENIVYQNKTIDVC